MKILHINTADTSGGAAKSAFRLHQGLRQRRHESRMLVGIKSETSSDIAVFPKRDTIFEKFKYRAVNAAGRHLGLQYLIFLWGNEFFSHPFVQDAAVINLHNIHGGFFSHTLLPQLSSQKPVVWTLHDPWSMTGHCGYPQVFGCEKWQTGCGGCPALDDYPEISIDTTAFLWKKKNDIYSRAKVTLVAPSKWLGEMAKASPLLGRFPVRHIPYGLDTSLYKPASKKEARDALGLPADKKIILFTAHDIHSPRKGIAHLLEALRTMGDENKNYLLVTLGLGTLTDAERMGIAHYRALPFVDDEKKMAAVYNAADVYVSPTLADNLPNTVLESLACGTPVVAFRVGGIPDMVINGQTGYAARPQDADDLARGLQEILADDAKREIMGRNARAMIENNFSLERQAQRYEALYAEALAGQ